MLASTFTSRCSVGRASSSTPLNSFPLSGTQHQLQMRTRRSHGSSPSQQQQQQICRAEISPQTGETENKGNAVEKAPSNNSESAAVRPSWQAFYTTVSLVLADSRHSPSLSNTHVSHRRNTSQGKTQTP